MDTDGEKPPEDKGIYRFLGRKDCIFSSPFPARIIPEVIISPSVSPTILFHSRTFSYFDRITYYYLTRSSLYIHSRRTWRGYQREMTIYRLFLAMCWNYPHDYPPCYLCLFFFYSLIPQFRKGIQLKIELCLSRKDIIVQSIYLASNW